MARRIKNSLTEFAIHALSSLKQVPAAHHLLLIAKLEAVARGEIDRLMIFMPPGSAKSTYASVLFPAWYMANNPHKNIIAASHTSSLADAFSKRVLNMVKDNSKLLGYTNLNEAAELWMTDNDCQYKAAGVGGAVTGFRADVALIDDPVKSRADADSETYREKAYNWYRSDLATRLKPNAAVILIQTRWHEDDLAGRLLQDDPGAWEVVKLPAMAEAGDPLGRAPGDMLWADDAYGYGKALLKIREDAEKGPGLRDWYSLYQQSPRPMTGSIFKPALISVVDAAPIGTTWCRGWDLAATAETGGRNPDWTTGAKIGRTPDGGFIIGDMVRFRGGPDEVLATIAATATRDGKALAISLPQDPGQAGVSQVKYFARKLAGFRLHVSRETGDKATRAMPFASQVNVGNVSMLRGEWNRALIDEMSAFPGGSFDDQIDALSRGFDMISGAGSALERARTLVR